MRQEYTRFTIQEEQELLPFLMKAMQGISRSRAKAILSGGGVRVNRAIVKQFDTPLKPRDIVEVSKQKPKATFQNRYVRIVYEDRHVIVIEKAAGILSMANVQGAFCVKSVLDDYFRKSHQRCRAHVVHRLDRETSGLLVYAKTMEAEQILEHNWQDIVTDRRYIALVSGQMEKKKGTVKSWLKENAAYVTYSSTREGDGKLAITHYETLETNEQHSLVRLKLETGRKNQIRVHMADLGHPVCGDTKYGNGDDPIHRLALHAYRLHFYHPITGEHLRFETPIPKPFALK